MTAVLWLCGVVLALFVGVKICTSCEDYRRNEFNEKHRRGR